MLIKHIITSKEKDLGDFSVRRLLPYAKQRMVGPWIFFDHMGPANFAAGQGINVRPHPHINLATVTYLFTGEILHRDSLGSLQTIQPGDINLMVAGKGITHSEREREEVHNRNHQLHGLQLWHVLPEEYEEIEPAFYHYPADKLAQISREGVSLRVMMGSAYGLLSPVKTFTQTLYIEAHLNQKAELPLPIAEELAVYVVAGTIHIADQEVSQYHMAVLDQSNAEIKIVASDDAHIAIIGGKKMSPRFIEWNFVSSRKERIEQAKNAWRQGHFPKVCGDEEEFIPLPE
jgi:redox-sensitive bicupin YhaK (pirin superfamily)